MRIWATSHIYTLKHCGFVCVIPRSSDHMSEFEYRQLHVSRAANDFYSGLAKPVHAAFKKGFHAIAATSWGPLDGLAHTMASEDDNCEGVKLLQFIFNNDAKYLWVPQTYVTDVCTNVKPMPNPRTKPHLVALQGQLYVFDNAAYPPHVSPRSREYGRRVVSYNPRLG